MFIVKHRSELVRFVIFALLAASMVYFVSGNVDTWLTSQAKGAGAAPANAEATIGPVREVAPGITVYTSSTMTDLPDVDEADYFADARIEREQARSQFQAQLKELMAAADSDVRSSAEKQYYDLGRAASLESRAEQLVMAKGFEDVLVHVEGSGAQVVVKTQALTQPQAVQIIDLVSRITGVKPSGVNVIPRER